MRLMGPMDPLRLIDPIRPHSLAFEGDGVAAFEAVIDFLQRLR